MPEHDVGNQKTREKADRGILRVKPQPTSQYLMAFDISSYLGETPFNPPIKRHAALLSSASQEQRVIIARQLQQTYGNRYVQRLVKSMTVQPKLTVGAADDPYEHEADKVAEQVLSMPAPSNNQVVAQRQTPDEEEVQTQPMSLVQRQAAEEEEQKLQMKPLIQREAPQDEEEIQTSHPPLEQTRDPRGSFETGSDVEERIQAQKGNGNPLSNEVRSFMEPRFGANFSDVRIHSGTDAIQLNRELSAQAFTHGQDIYLGEGKNNPDSSEGKRLLAHELTHVVQQSNLGVGRSGEFKRKKYLKQPASLNKSLGKKQDPINRNTADSPLSYSSVSEVYKTKKLINKNNGNKEITIQRWKLEGPWNIGEPVHETLTEKALKAAKMIGLNETYTSKDAWEYTRGAIWNDDPEGLLFDDTNWLGQATTTKYSSGLAFYNKFSGAEEKANKGTKFGPREKSLLKRSHFGDLQFLHGMAVQGEEAAKTRANMLMWGEFTYKVGSGTIPGETELQNVNVNGIPQLFPDLNKGTTVAMLFCIRDNLKKLADVKKRAIGSLLHMIEDTFASSHTEREYKPGGNVGQIESFHSYTGQSSEKHAAKDVPSGYSKAEYAKREESAVQASADILKMLNENKDWELVKSQLEIILGLVDKPNVAAPGQEFEEEKPSPQPPDNWRHSGIGY